MHRSADYVLRTSRNCYTYFTANYYIIKHKPGLYIGNCLWASTDQPSSRNNAKAFIYQHHTCVSMTADMNMLP